MLSWPAAGSVGAGLANLYLLWYLWRSRDAPGARWFLAVVGVQVYWGVVYGVALATFDPGLRLALEAATWLAPTWIGVFYVAFALAYTGRGHLLEHPWFKALVGFEVAMSALVLTNPLHGLVWGDFAVDPVFGAATVTYTHGVWVYLQYFTTFALASTGVFVLLDTVASYGPDYRAQSVAVALTPLPPALAFTAWVFQVGPFWQLNLTAIMFLPHVALDLYALFRRDMFEFHPATRRAGERAAVDDLGNPVVIVDESGRVVTLNGAAADCFDVDAREAFTRPIEGLLDGQFVDFDAGEQQVDVRTDGRRRTFTLTPSPLTDGAGNLVGHTVVLYDLTEELRREQRLDVLNRVLRHNLRNDVGIVRSYAVEASDRTDDEEVSRLLDVVDRKADGLVDLGEKARRVERILAREPAPREVDLRGALGEVVESVGEAYPEATISLSCPEGSTVTAEPETLRVACENLIENAAEHGGEAPVVEVRVERTGPETRIEVVDDGPGIPDLELDTLDAGEETPLQHGQGLGLWIAHWLSDRAGAELAFETDETGTRASLTFPG